MSPHGTGVIKAASGQYITNANTDDRHRKDALEVMASFLDKKPDIGLVYADVLVTQTENETFGQCTARLASDRSPAYNRSLLTMNCFIGPQPMWRKSLHEKYGYFDETFQKPPGIGSSGSESPKTRLFPIYPNTWAYTSAVPKA